MALLECLCHDFELIKELGIFEVKYEFSSNGFHDIYLLLTSDHVYDSDSILVKVPDHHSA